MTLVDKAAELWAPSEEDISEANISAYMHWLAQRKGAEFKSYDQLWQWSVTNIQEFWQSMWRFFDIKASSQPTSIMSEGTMPGIRWFPGARLNYAENFFSRANWDRTAMVYCDERGSVKEIAWQELYASTAALTKALRDMGVQPGDRVVAYLPNIPETIIALFATASLGAIWSSCSPEFGSRSVLDRFQQIEPKVLITVDGYRYGGKVFDRQEVVAELVEGLPTLQAVILVPFLAEEGPNDLASDFVRWERVVAGSQAAEPLQFEQLAFDHPLWVLYSSGTTGLPKAIVQGHGGILLEHLKMTKLHLDLRSKDRFFWYTSTGWMMWNFLVGGLLSGAAIVLYNGSPTNPAIDFLWKLAADIRVTYFGTSAAYIGACAKAEIKPSQKYDLEHIKTVGSTGSPLTADNFHWIYQTINSRLALQSVSGGTDLCTAFVGGCKLLPIHAGEIQAAALGASVWAFDAGGSAVVEEVGELVITKPMPSMPIYFWNDPDNKRYLSSYFEMYPGVWRHGDWIMFTERGSCLIYGRSDSTINRKGIRMGTGEIYQVVESFPEIRDSLLIDLEFLGRDSFMLLFVVLTGDASLDDGLTTAVKQAIKLNNSPHHVPDEIIVIEEVPYTLSGKKMEVPVRRILLRQPVDEAVNQGAMRNPNSIDVFVKFATEARFNPA